MIFVRNHSKSDLRDLRSTSPNSNRLTICIVGGSIEAEVVQVLGVGQSSIHKYIYILIFFHSDYIMDLG